jgi:hypothetical protein
MNNFFIFLLNAQRVISTIFCFSIDTILKRKTIRQTAPYGDEDTTAKD